MLFVLWILTALVVSFDTLLFLKKFRSDRHSMLTFNLVIGIIIHQVGSFNWFYNDIKGHRRTYLLGKNMCMFHVLSYNFGLNFIPVTVATITWHTWVSVFHSDLYHRFVTDRKFLIIVVTPIIVASILATSFLVPYAPTISAIRQSRGGAICTIALINIASIRVWITSTWVLGNLIPTLLVQVPMGLMIYSTVMRIRSPKPEEKTAQSEEDVPSLIYACVSTCALNVLYIVCNWPMYLVSLSRRWVHAVLARDLYYWFWLLSAVIWLFLQRDIGSWILTLIVKWRQQGPKATILEVVAMVRICDLHWRKEDDEMRFDNPSAVGDPEVPDVK